MRFIATRELGRLAKWLRIMGYDVVYHDKEEKRELVIISLREERVILTRDSRMSRYTGLKLVHVDSDFVDEQVRQIMNELHIKPDEAKLFSRCVICNDTLIGIAKKDVEGRVAPYVYETREVFMKCPKCERIYWHGTHWEKVKNMIEKL
jgi:uncharacterized protein